jgi:diaminopimelate decarboxylase
MHEFKYIGNDFCCEKVRLQDLAKRYRTPLYVYSYHTLIDHLLKLQSAFQSVKPLICYSVKANSNLAILKALVNAGAGLDIVSGGELYRAIKAGCPAERIVYASVGKTDPEIEAAIRSKILFFNVESLPELENINRIAAKLRVTVRVALRINPDVEPKTHKYITTGKLTNKFGIDFHSARQIILLRNALKNISICGLHIHIGSQITESAPYVAAITKMLSFIKEIRFDGVTIEYLNIGVGLGIVYDDETPQTAASFAATVLPLLRASKLKIIMEPGRFIAGQSGLLMTKVLYVKKTPLKKFIIVDAGMNDLIRPALYEAFHEILPVTRSGGGVREKADVVGPICESGDFLAKDRLLAPVQEGDYLAVRTAGAYGFSMSSNYNSRLKAAEIMVVNDKAHMIRRRDTHSDLTRNEIIPGFLKER